MSSIVIVIIIIFCIFVCLFSLANVTPQPNETIELDWIISPQSLDHNPTMIRSATLPSFPSLNPTFSYNPINDDIFLKSLQQFYKLTPPMGKKAVTAVRRIS